MYVLLLFAVIAAGDDFPITERLQPAFVITERHSPTVASEPERSERVLFFTASWCNPCKHAKAEMLPWLTPSGWVVSESPSAHVQLVDADDNPQMLAEYKITSLPTFVLIRNRRELRRAGYSDKTTVVNLWFGKAQTQPTQQSVALSTIAGEASPTPISEVVRVLSLLPKPEVGFVEFGCGADARWCVAAVERWGCKATGIEIDPERAAAAREHIHKLGLEHLITIIEGDATQVDVDADVGAAYLYNETLEALRPLIERQRAFASYMHQPPGLPVVRNGDTFLYTKPVVQQQVSQRYAVWGGQIYYSANPGCNCAMCQSIRRQLQGK